MKYTFITTFELALKRFCSNYNFHFTTAFTPAFTTNCIYNWEYMWEGYPHTDNHTLGLNNALLGDKVDKLEAFKYERNTFS